MGAVALLSGAHVACAAAAGFAGVAALAIAELSTTETFAACTSCLLCRGLFLCGHAVFIHDADVWVQWTGDPKPKIENGDFMELVNAS